MLQVGIYGNLIVLLSMCANFFLRGPHCVKSALITRVIGAEGTDIVSKIAALLMTAIAFCDDSYGSFRGYSGQSLEN